MNKSSAERLGLRACIGLLAAATLSACASGPIDMAGGADAPAPRLAEQAALRGAAEALTARVEEAGWSLAPPPGDQARSFLGRLIGGGGETAEAAEADPVQVYIDAAGSPGAVDADLSMLTRSARTVSTEALSVAASPEGLSRSALERDIAAAEQALGALRRARAFFAEVEAEFVAAGAGDLNGALDTLREAETGLAEAADALAERRWSGYGETLAG